MPDGRSVIRVVTFVDLWNLMLGARSRLGPLTTGIDWTGFTEELLDFAGMGLGGHRVDTDPLLRQEAVLVYGGLAKSGVGSESWAKLVGDYPGFRVYLDPVKRQNYTCKHCNGTVQVRRESQTDARLISDLMWLAWQDSYDVAIVVSGDRDLVPTIERIQLSGRKVISALFDGTSNPSRMVSHSSVSLDAILTERTAYEPDSRLRKILDAIGPSYEPRRTIQLVLKYGHDIEALIRQLREEESTLLSLRFGSGRNDVVQVSQIDSIAERLRSLDLPPVLRA